MLPKNDIVEIKYFTARVKPRPGDPGQPNRQQMYIRALRTIPNISIYYGHFLSNTVRLPLALPSGKNKFVDVCKTEEKGSDVNLTTHLLCDGYEDSYDVAVIISNDSDLVEPVRVVKTKLGKKVGLLNPHKHPSRQLSKYSHFMKKIRKGVLKHSQFPPQLKDKHGTIVKPSSW
jgi:hypothetical protein